ncbi:hypothetical protein JL722_14448 [Aureococcus anophagefferens]|nr:hypothetical protein JL722_14448 [Aureococcus anophagefferens]
MSTCEAHKLTPTPRRKRGLSVAGTASRHVFLDPSLVELVLEACVSLNDVKLLSGVSRATRRARWPFETLSGHVGIRAMIARSGDDTSFENWARTARRPSSAANIAAMVEQLSSYRAMAASGGLLRQLCPGCTQTLREGLGASCARAAFSLGYSCVRSESGWSNAHAIVGACGHASLFAVAFGESDDLDASRSAGWGPKEACAWALVQLLSVAKKRMSCKALVAQLRQLGVARACADAVLAPLPMLEAGQSKRRASSVSLYLAECDAAAAEDDDEELLNHMLDGEHGLTPQQQQQLQQQRANRTSRQAAALVDCPAALARRAVEHLGGLGPPPRTHPGPWLHAVDSLAAFVASRAARRADAEALLGDRANLAFVDVLLKVERRAQEHRPLDDDRFFYGADRVDTTVFGVLSALAKLPRGREELMVAAAVGDDDDDEELDDDDDDED